MLKKEFEARTNLSMTVEEFNGVNALYMACGDGIDKDKFCKLYVTMDGRLELLHRIEREHQRVKEALFDKEMLHQEAMEIISDAADAVLEIGKDLLDGQTVEHTDREVFAARQLEKKAWWLVGKKEVIKRKAKMGMSFSEEEIDYINDNLK